MMDCRISSLPNRLGKNLLYHNEGSGTFRLVTEISVVQEGRRSAGCSWVDYDNDGDLDLSVANGMWSDFEQSCELYRNEGGTNSWIILNLVGTVSNRSAIGAKVWAQATIDGHDLTRNCGRSGRTRPARPLRSRDATKIDTLRIEWPSGIVQEYTRGRDRTVPDHNRGRAFRLEAVLKVLKRC